uniref:Uncharacterized protein n=1 Tax=Tanacetum cinerariifolium TaxID=118510 RepID=A0A6L2KAA0_TANCI|nr:hypothetical protein [Tanacetum cinerariifolium]
MKGYDHIRQKMVLELANAINREPFVQLEEALKKVTEELQPSDPIKHVADEAVYKELDDSLVPRSHGDTINQTRSKRVSKLSNDSLLARGNTHQSDEDIMKLNELMELCTNLQTNVIDLEKTKTTQALEITSLKKRVNKLEKKQREEQEELTIEEKSTLFKELLEKRRKHFAAKAAEEKKKKPPTQAQQRKIMCTYLKNMEGNKLKDLKNKSFDSIQKMCDRAFNRVNTFVDFRTEMVEGSSKRSGEELTQESTKKQKVDDDKETAQLK